MLSYNRNTDINVGQNPPSHYCAANTNVSGLRGIPSSSTEGKAVTTPSLYNVVTFNNDGVSLMREGRFRNAVQSFNHALAAGKMLLVSHPGGNGASHQAGSCASSLSFSSSVTSCCEKPDINYLFSGLKGTLRHVSIYRCGVSLRHTITLDYFDRMVLCTVLTFNKAIAVHLHALTGALTSADATSKVSSLCIKARELYECSWSLLDPLLQAFPRDPSVRLMVTIILNNVGSLESQLNRSTEAAQYFRQVFLETSARLDEAEPSDPCARCIIEHCFDNASLVLSGSKIVRGAAGA